MATITIKYDKNTQTFVGCDGFDNKITFKADRDVITEASPSEGKTLGPMMSLLLAAGACSAIDIVMILEKQRQSFDGLDITIRAQREKDKVPALWEKIDVAYELQGNVDLDKAQKAAALSVDKYCSVLETLRRAGATVTHSVKVN